MEFFDPPPPDPVPPRPLHPKRYRVPDWFGPQENVLPGIVGLELMLVSTDRVCVWLGSAAVYPSGIVLEVTILGRQAAEPGVESGEGTWRFGVQFADGAKAVTYGLGALARVAGGSRGATSYAQAVGCPSEPPHAPQLSARGGSGSRMRWQQEYWLWPLPPPGDVLVACEWPNIGIRLSTASIDANRLREAARRAQEIWSDDELAEWPG